MMTNNNLCQSFFTYLAFVIKMLGSPTEFFFKVQIFLLPKGQYRMREIMKDSKVKKKKRVLKEFQQMILITILGLRKFIETDLNIYNNYINCVQDSF